MNKRTFLGLLGLSALGAYALRRRLAAIILQLPPPRYAIGVERGVRVRMPDGVTLVADHYYPKARGMFPTILVRTGYGRELEAGWWGRGFGQLMRFFAERGYHVVLQTIRGRFESEGDFEPLGMARADGLATLEWIAQQPWFNGAVGMWGSSWLGYMQWAVAADAPPYLKAIVPSITASQFYSAVYPDGVFGLEVLLYWVTSIMQEGVRGRAPHKRSLKEIRRMRAQACMHLPLYEADAVAVGTDVSFFHDWLAHPRRAEDYWQRVDNSQRMAEVAPAVHLVSGWQDFFLRELLDDYQALRVAGKEPYLTVGPWFHSQVVGTLESVRQGLHWFDAHLKGQRDAQRAKAVRVYVMGADEWREFDVWPPATAPVRYYLHAQQALAAAPPPTDAPPDHYRYDPADPTPALGGPLFDVFAAGIKDNAPLEARPDVLYYTSPPLTQPLTIMGVPTVELYVRSSLVHTDFFARVCDVQPDGRSLNVSDGLLRVAPGVGEPQPDGSLRLTLALWSTAYQFQSGHRIRLQVSSGAHPRWSRNLGTGEPVATATHMRCAEQTIYHDAAHPAQVTLPALVD